MRTRKLIGTVAVATVMTGCAIILALAGASLIGCATATIDEPAACDTVSLGTVPASPVAGVPLPPQTFTSNFDFSGTIKKIGDVADNLSANVSQLTMNNNGDLQWVSQVDVTVTGDSQDTPEAPFASYTSNGDPGQQVTVNVKMDQGTILKYLEHPITLKFTVNGTAPTQTVNFTNTMCVDVSGSVSKGL